MIGCRNLSELIINPNGFVFEPSLGEGFLLNDSGLLVLDCLRGGLSVEVTARKLSDAYDLSLGQAFTDTFDFISKLRILGFEVKT